MRRIMTEEVMFQKRNGKSFLPSVCISPTTPIISVGLKRRTKSVGKRESISSLQVARNSESGMVERTPHMTHVTWHDMTWHDSCHMTTKIIEKGNLETQLSVSGWNCVECGKRLCYILSFNRALVKSLCLNWARHILRIEAFAVWWIWSPNTGSNIFKLQGRAMIKKNRGRRVT